MVAADWTTLAYHILVPSPANACFLGSVDQSVVTICGCGQQLLGTQQVQPSQLTRGEMREVGFHSPADVIPLIHCVCPVDEHYSPVAYSSTAVSL